MGTIFLPFFFLRNFNYIQLFISFSLFGKGKLGPMRELTHMPEEDCPHMWKDGSLIRKEIAYIYIAAYQGSTTAL